MQTRIRLAALLALSLAFSAAAPASAGGPPTRQSADAAAYHERLIVVWKTPAPTALHIPGVKSTKAAERPASGAAGSCLPASGVPFRRHRASATPPPG